MDKVNILVCDDDKEIVDAIEIYLQQEGYHVIKAYDGEQAIEQLEKNDVQLLIMDVMMPRLDGIRATLKIRENSSIPIIILSAKTEDADKILGLNIGADDYISKPFNPLELVARVKSQLRRYMHLGNVADENMSVYRVGGLEINDDLKEVKVDGETIRLTPIEYNILLLLVKNAGKVAITLGSCCTPIPGDDIVGYITKGKGITVHRRNCPNIQHEHQRLIDVYWNEQLTIGTYPVDIAIESSDRPNLLVDFMAVFAQLKVSISSISAKVHPSTMQCTVQATIYVSDAKRLTDIFNVLLNIQGVYDVRRVIH